MCRLMAYVGQPQLLADIVLWPDRSIIKQSYDARERKIDPTLPFHLGHGNLNGDGFGIGWFGTDERRERDPTPCVFTSITPAWNNENLSRLACKIVSPLVFAHVRAAYPGMPVSEQNCHPFQFSRYMWMHNGVVAGFAQIRRSLLETLSDCAYNAVASFHSDSAVSFAVFLNHLPDMRAQLAPDVLIKAMQDTIATISAIQRRHGITATSLLNYVVSDGTTLIATRFVSPETDGPASLYYAEGASFSRTTPSTQMPTSLSPAAAAGGAGGAAGPGCGAAVAGASPGEGNAAAGGTAAAGPGPGLAPCSASANSGSSITQESSYELGVSAQGPAVVFVASEPITASASDWVAVPKNTALVVTREKGGWLNTLRCPLRTTPPTPLHPSPSTILPPAGPSTLAGAGPWIRGSSGGGAATTAAAAAAAAATFGAVTTAHGASAILDPQRDVCLCLEALSRGITAKSRAFVAHRHTGLGMGSSAILPPAQETMQELPSGAGAQTPAFGRGSLGGQAGGPVQMETAVSMGTPLAVTASRAGSAGLEVTANVAVAAAPDASADTHDYMRLVGHSGPVIALTVCAHTSRLYTSSVDCSVRVWSMRDNSCLHTMIGQRKPVTAMRLRAQGRLLLASSGRKIRVWDAIGFRCLQLIKISDSCGTIRCLEVFGIHHARPSSAALQGADSSAAGGAGGRRVSGASPDCASGRSSATGEDIGLGLRSPNGRGRMSSVDGGGSSSVSLLEGLSMQDIILDAFSDRDGSSGVTADGASSATGGRSSISGMSLLYVGCQDTTVKVFTLDEHQLLAAAAAAAAAVAVASMTVVPSLSAAAAQAAAAAGTSPATVAAGSGNADGPALSAATALLGKSSSKKASMGTTTPPPSPFMPPRRDSSVQYSRTSVTGLAGPPALLPPRIITTPEEPEHGVSELVPLMVTAADGGAHVGPVNCLALCGRYLCSGGGDATVRVWEATTLRLVAVLRGHRGSVLCLLGLGSSTLLSGARDNTIRVWDLEMDMMCRRTLTGHKDDVTGLTALALPRPQLAQGPGTPAGLTSTPGRSAALASTLVASSSADGCVRLWSTSWTCLCILSLPLSSSPSVPAALCNCLTADLAMAGYSDGEVRLWHVDDVQAAVLKTCYSEFPWEADVLGQAAGCGCVGHGVDPAAVAAAVAAATGGHSGAVQAALALLQQPGPAPPMTTAAAAATPAAQLLPACNPLRRSATVARWPECSQEQGQDAALATVTVQTVPGATAPSPFCARHDTAASASRRVADSSRGADEQPTANGCSGDAAANGGLQPAPLLVDGPPARRPMIESPSLAHLVGGGRSHGSASNLHSGQPSESGQLPLPGAAGDEGVTAVSGPRDGDTTASNAREGQDRDKLKEGQEAETTPVSGPSHAAPGQTSDANVAGGGVLVPAGPAGSSGGAAPGGCSQLALALCGSSTGGAGTVLPLASGAPGGGAVPIHIHGRRSPLSSNSVANMAAMLAGAGCCGPLPLPLGSLPLPLSSLVGHFCSTSDQQLEAALRDFVRIKTVSSSPKLRDDCHKGAKFVAKMLEGLGADVKVVQVYEDKNPVVIGRLGHNNDRPTVTFYGHYDVQPAAEPDWATNPFELNSVNEYLYGRGVSDNKGPILAFIFAVRELMNSCGDGTGGGGGGAGRAGRLPVNIAFVFEGEEENGSRGFATAVTQNLRWFEGTQLIIISNTLWVGENVPCLTYGMRGMLSLTVQITGPERDLHSGNDGGVFAEPMIDLLRVMATLVGPGGQVQVPGFYDDVEPGLIDLAWKSLETSEEFSLEGYKAALGVPSLTAPPYKRDLLVTRWCRPSLSVVDMRPGSLVASQQSEPATCYRFGPTRFSVIPKAAQGKVSVRFVPNQDADRLVSCLRRHVRNSFKALGSSNTIDLHVEARGNWWEARQGSPWLAMAEAAIFKEWGVQPLYVREGGTMPVASYLERILCAPAIMIPMGQSSDNCHLANERIRRTNLFKGKNVIRRLLEEIAAMGPPTSSPGGPEGAPYANEAMLATSWGAPTACAGMAE